MRRYQITIGEKPFEVEILSVEGDRARVLVNGRSYEVKFQALAGAAGPPPVALRPGAPPKVSPPATPARVGPPRPKPGPAPAAGAPGAVTAPMPGAILDVLVKVGDRVKAGDTVVKLEAMKMENDVRASMAGVVSEVRVSKGMNVTVGEVLVVVAGT